jgi:aminoglycoside phosphotransferase (APT) family kinase protein
MKADATQLTPAEERIVAWLRREFGAEIEHFSRQLRWRAGWEAHVRTPLGLRRLYVRGSKGSNYFGPVTLQQEAALHGILERYGIPVPHVHGMIDDPVAIVMDHLPGQINLSTAASDSARASIRAQYVAALARMHAIPTREFAAIGMPIPSGAERVALNLYAPCEKIYRERMGDRPFALMDFMWRWLTRNVPRHRIRSAFITADSGQFLFEDERLIGLIDLEVGYVGDPIAEFAGLRLRDSTEPLGDIAALADQYQLLTGDSIDKRSIEYHTAGFTAVNGFLLWPLAFRPVAEQDYIAYLSFAVGTCRWGMDAIAEHMGVDLGEVATAGSAPLAFAAASAHLVGSVSRLPVDGDVANYQRERASCLARYLERWNEYGANILAANLEDASELLGRRQNDAAAAEEALVRYVRDASPDQDARLATYFHRWLHRQDFLLRDCGTSSWLTGTHLQRIPPR